MTAAIRPLFVAAQGLEGLVGGWELDTAVSTFVAGDAVRLDIRLTPREVSVTRIFKASGPPPSVLTLALDGSAPPPPRVGSARVIDGKLVVTHTRAREVVTHVYTVEGDTLSVERSIQGRNPANAAAPPLKHVMVFSKIAN
jgi:hypothetical protein